MAHTRPVHIGVAPTGPSHKWAKKVKAKEVDEDLWGAALDKFSKALFNLGCGLEERTARGSHTEPGIRAGGGKGAMIARSQSAPGAGSNDGRNAPRSARRPSHPD